MTLEQAVVVVAGFFIQVVLNIYFAVALIEVRREARRLARVEEPTWDAYFDGDTIIDIAATPSGGGYWLLDADGAVREFGDAIHYGSPYGDEMVLNEPVAAIAADPLGRGYWIAAQDGGVFTYGEGLPFYGSDPER